MVLSAADRFGDAEAVVELIGARSPDIMADAAVEILSRPSTEVTGRCFIDADVLTESGVCDLSVYGGGDHPLRDLFLD